jgi:hypothetical protein
MKNNARNIEETYDDKKKLDFPTLGFGDRVIDLAKTIQERGGQINLQQILKDLKISKGASGSLIAASKRYGIITNAGKEYALTPLGEEVVNENSSISKAALIKAFLNVPKFKHFFEKYNFSGELPKLSIVKDSVKTVGIDENYSAKVANAIRSNLTYLNCSFQDIKNFERSGLTQKGTNGNKEQENDNNNEQPDESAIKSAFELGYKLGALISSTTKLDDVKNELEKFKPPENLPMIAHEIEKAISLIESGVLTDANFTAYAKVAFVKAIETDLGKSELQ